MEYRDHSDIGAATEKSELFQLLTKLRKDLVTKCFPLREKLNLIFSDVGNLKIKMLCKK